MIFMFLGFQLIAGSGGEGESGEAYVGCVHAEQEN